MNLGTLCDRMSVIDLSNAEQDAAESHPETQVDATSRLNGGRSPPLKSKNAHLEDEDELSRLRALATDVREQDDLERDVGRQVRDTLKLLCSCFLTHVQAEQLLVEQANDRDQRRLEKARLDQG